VRMGTRQQRANPPHGGRIMMLYIVVLNRGPALPAKRLGYGSERLAWWKAEELRFIHGVPQVVTASDANATVLYIDASPWYTRAHS